MSGGMGWDTVAALVAVVLSLVALLRDEIKDRLSRRAKLEVWQRNTINLSVGSGPQIPTRVTLVFRNLTNRPTAVLDVYVREAGGGILGGRGYRERIPVPLQLGGWGVAEVSFDLEPDDEKRTSDIQVTDLDGDEIVIPQDARRAGWHRVRARG